MTPFNEAEELIASIRAGHVEQVSAEGARKLVAAIDDLEAALVEVRSQLGEERRGRRNRDPNLERVQERLWKLADKASDEAWTRNPEPGH